MPPIPIEAIDWESVKAAYIANVLTIGQIIERYGVSRDRLYRRAKQHTWPKRGRKKVLPPQCPMENGATLTCPALVHVAPLEKRAALAARLFHALEEHILAIEEDALNHDAAHGERDAKALSAMARALEQLSAMLDTADPSGDAASNVKVEELDADEFRELLKDRLDRLSASGPEPASDGSSQ